MGSLQSNDLQGTKFCPLCVSEPGNGSFPIKPSCDCIQAAAITRAYICVHVWTHTITHFSLLSAFIISVLVVEGYN